MSKITELGPITGSNTRPEDLFVVVNLVQGDDGTKSITRRELVQAIQFEEFDRIQITGGNISDVVLSDSDIDSVVIENSEFNNGSILDSSATNLSLTTSTFDLGDITNSEFSSGTLDDVDGITVRLSNSEIIESTLDDVSIINSTLEDSTIETTVIGNSEFNNGIGDTNLFTNTILEQGEITNFNVANTTFADGELKDSTASNLNIIDSAIANTDIDGSVITNATFKEGIIDKSKLVDFDMELDNKFEDLLDEESYFALKNAKTGETEQFSYKQFFDEISKTTESALKVYVSADGDDNNPATILQPVKTLKRASEIALEKAGGSFNRNDVNNAVHISVGPGTYYLREPVPIPDDCAITSSAGQYATVIEMEEGFSKTNGILVGSGGYVQGFSFQNFEIDNFDYPEQGFGVAYRPGALLRRSPYTRDCTQLSNFRRDDVEPPLQPFNSKGTIDDLGNMITLDGATTGSFEVDDEVTFSSGAFGYISRLDELTTENVIYVRNLKGEVNSGDLIVTNYGASGVVLELGEEDFPNKLVGRGGGVVLADRRQLDPDSLYTYFLCFGATPRTQNGMGYVARDGAGVNGIGSLSIFVRCAFYALNGGQMTLNNSGTQFGDISMRAKGSTEVYQPKSTTADIIQDVNFAETIEQNKDDIIDDLVNYLDTSLGYTGYNADKCERDTGILVSNVGYDVALDTNYWGRLNGITYRSPISYIVVNDQLTETTAAINHLRGQVDRLFANADAEVNSRTAISFDETINILENGEPAANDIIFADTGNIGRTAARTLIQDNKDLIANEFIDWIEDNENFFAYNSTKCKRDTTDYILPAVKYDTLLDTNYNSITAGNAYYMATASKVLGNQKDETIGAYRRLKDQTNELLDLSGSFIATDRADDAFDNIVTVLENGPSTGITFSDNVAINADQLNARRQLQANRSYIQDHIMGYIQDTYFIYDSNKCSRDVEQYILPAVQRDMTLGTNFNSIQSGVAYYAATASQVINDELPETVAAVSDLKTKVSNLIATDTPSVNRSNAAFDELIDIMSNGTAAADAVTWSDPALVGVTLNGQYARERLQTNRSFIQEENIAWIEDNYPDLEYNAELCQRDVGYVVDAVSKDLEYSGNANTVKAIEYYFANAVNILPADQRDPTKESFRHLATVIESVIRNNVVVPVSAITETQDFGGVAGAAAVASAGRDLVLSIANVVDDTELATPELVNPVFDSNRTFARKILQNNKSFLQEEIVKYLDDRYFTYNGEKCSRDVAYILNAVKRDVVTGSNFNTIFAGLAYRSGTAGTDLVISEQLTETVNAIEFVRDNVLNSISDGDAKSRTTDAFGELIKILSLGASEASAIDYGGPAASGNNANANTQLQRNKLFLQAEAIAYINANYPALTFDETKCSRDIGYLVDSVSFDVTHGSNTASIQNAIIYFENAVSILPVDQRAPTADTFAHIASVANLIVQESTVTPTAGNSETQDTAAGSAGGVLGTVVEGLINIVSDAVTAGDLDSLPVLVEPSAAYASGYVTAVSEIEGAISKQQTDVITYINNKFNGLAYDSEKCRRDIGYIVDAVSHDIQYDGNAATLNAAQIYFSNAVNILPLTQREPTKIALTRLANVIEKVVFNVPVTISKGNLITQDVSEIATNQDIARDAKQLALIVANVSNESTSSNLPVRVEPDISWVAPNYIVSKELIEDQIDVLVEGVIEYIAINQNGLSFPVDRCQRDIGLIVDAVSHDVQYDGNIATKIVAQIYFESGVSVLPEFTRSQTADVYAYMANLLSDIVVETDTENLTYTSTQQVVGSTPATATEGATVSSLIGIIEDVIRANSLSGIPATVQPDTSWVDADVINAVATIDTNSEILADDMVEWINTEYSVLDYDKTKCARDSIYLLDAFSFDLNYGGNTASRWNADFYFWNNILRIPENQREATALSYRQLGRICADILIGKHVNQTTNSELATIAEVEKVQKLANIFYNTLINNDVKKLPLLEEPDYTWQSSKFVGTKTILDLRKKSLAQEVVRFVNAEFKYYNLELTRRDAGNLITTLANDFKTDSSVFGTFGSQKATRTFVASLFDYDGTHVFPVFNPATSGLKFMGTVIGTGGLPTSGQKVNHAYIAVPNQNALDTNFYDGNIYYWSADPAGNGSQPAGWVLDGPNNTELLEAFYLSWRRMKVFMEENYLDALEVSPKQDSINMLNGLIEEVLIQGVLTPDVLTFGSLVESIAHQFNGASAGVNRTALPLNFRNIGQPISASASVLSEDGGRVRWSGSDELNNQYFARGLKINGRTGRIEGRPFTSSVRKLARRASNSRANI